MAILHGNLCPTEILFTSSDCLKICHFGCKLKLDHETVGQLYLAPEIHSKKLIDESCDVWSLGIIAYELVKLKRPFTTIQGIINHYRIEDIDMEDIPSDIAEFIEKCMQPNRLFRPLCDALLKHSIFN